MNTLQSGPKQAEASVIHDAEQFHGFKVHAAVIDNPDTVGLFTDQLVDQIVAARNGIPLFQIRRLAKQVVPQPAAHRGTIRGVELHRRALRVHDDQADVLDAGAAFDLLVKLIRIDGIVDGRRIHCIIHLGQCDPLLPDVIPFQKGAVDDPAGPDGAQHQEKEDDGELEPQRIAGLVFFMIFFFILFFSVLRTIHIGHL